MLKIIEETIREIVMAVSKFGNTAVGHIGYFAWIKKLIDDKTGV